LAAERILIVGVGGLGVPAAWALARAGARRLTLVDPELVELSNLARQVIYRVDDIGKPKAKIAARRLAAKFPGLEIDARVAEFNASNCAELAAEHDFIIDGTDNPATKFLINDAVIAAGRPFSYGGVIGMTGQTMTVVPGTTACLRCLFESPPDPAEVASCREAGIAGPVAGAIGIVQADEAMRAINGLAPSLAGKILTYNTAEPARVRIAAVAVRPGCGCGAAKGKGAGASLYQ
jgi:molybdopterin-synthase adenylyltransferase